VRRCPASRLPRLRQSTEQELSGRGGTLSYAGKVGTGFTMKSARTLTDKLEPLNDYTATANADISVRARLGAPVALPLSRNELDDLESASQFTIKNVLARLKRKKPPAVPRPQRLPGL
jgi:hypothetical protein